MGRYDHLKRKEPKRKSKLKLFREIATVVVISMVIAGFIFQLIVHLKK